LPEERALAQAQIGRSLKVWAKRADAQREADRDEAAPAATAGDPTAADEATQSDAAPGEQAGEAEAAGAEGEAAEAQPEEAAPEGGAKPVARKIFRAEANNGSPAGGTRQVPPEIDAATFDADLAQKALTTAFENNSLRIQKPAVTLLEDAEVAGKMDSIYGPGTFAEKTKGGHVIRGFHDNIGGTGVYLNKTTAETKTLLHEMLHANESAEWRELGTAYHEGMTETMAIEACTINRIKMCQQNYGAERTIIAATVSAGISLDSMKTAYFLGGCTLMKETITRNCKGSWARVKAAVDADDLVAARGLLQRK
jgi:hypothetical protein